MRDSNFRIQQRGRMIRKRLLQAKSHGSFYEHIKNRPGKLDKMNAFTCGDSNCVMCGNPRKFFGDPTLAEKSHAMLTKTEV